MLRIRDRNLLGHKTLSSLPCWAKGFQLAKRFPNLEMQKLGGLPQNVSDLLVKSMVLRRISFRFIRSLQCLLPKQISRFYRFLSLWHPKKPMQAILLPHNFTHKHIDLMANENFARQDYSSSLYGYHPYQIFFLQCYRLFFHFCKSDSILTLCY